MMIKTDYYGPADKVAEGVRQEYATVHSRSVVERPQVTKEEDLNVCGLIDLGSEFINGDFDTSYMSEGRRRS